MCWFQRKNTTFQTMVIVVKHIVNSQSAYTIACNQVDKKAGIKLFQISP